MSVTLTSRREAEILNMTSRQSKITKTPICIQISILQPEMVNSQARAFSLISKTVMFKPLKMNIQQTHHWFNSVLGPSAKIFQTRWTTICNSIIWISRASRWIIKISRLRKIIPVHRLWVTNLTLFRRGLSNSIISPTKYISWTAAKKLSLSTSTPTSLLLKL